MSKPVLFQKLKEQFDFDRLQRQENRRLRINDCINVKKRSIYSERDTDSPSPDTSVSKDDISPKKFRRQPLNKIDPIMFSPIKKNKDKVFKLIRPNGGAVVFNIDTLVEYIANTGDFTDPVTRIPFSDDDLQDIDAKVSVRFDQLV